MLFRTDVAPLGQGKVLSLSGSPYEQGRQLGQGAAELIRENLQRTRTQRHAEPPVESICRHGGDGTSRTYAATINCPQARTMWVTIGNPCEGIQAVGRPGG